MGASNAVTRQVTDYGTDPATIGPGLIREALLRLNGFLVPHNTGGDGDPHRQFSGYVNGLQNFKSYGAPVATASFSRDGAADLSDAVTANPMGDPVRRIFADRLRRGRVGYV